MIKTGFVRVGGAWINKTKKGEEYLVTRVQVAIPRGASLFLFKNNDKASDSSPDYTVQMTDSTWLSTPAPGDKKYFEKNEEIA